MKDFASISKYKLGGDTQWHVLDDIDEILDETADCYSKSEIYDLDLSSFRPQKTLNERIWVNGKINSKVRSRLLSIADDFVDTLEVDWVEPDDIILVGSLANYNWSKYSDFDLHIVMDFNKVDERTEFVTDYFDAKKNAWNDLHEDLKIYGFPVELYVQDVNADVTASGVYSLEYNEWLIEPEYDNIKSIKLNKFFIKEKAISIMKKIDSLLEKAESGENAENISNKCKKLFDKIKGIRKSALSNGDEMSSGNLIFKVLRRNGYIEKLVDLKNKTYDKMNSILQN